MNKSLRKKINDLKYGKLKQVGINILFAIVFLIIMGIAGTTYPY